MKEIIKNENLKNSMIEAIDLLCDTVASTLGPTGNNVIINSELSPFITNDGVTIARSIESSDEIINSILEIAKEASLKTNDVVGDGTTTTLVLLQSIFKESLKENINPILLKKEINETLNSVIIEINKIKKLPTKKDLLSIATTSSNDKKIGEFIYEVFTKMKSKYAIRLEESKINETYYEVKKGYSLELNDISSLYFKDRTEVILNNVYILLLDGYLNDLELINDIINEGIIREKNIVILASDYDELIRNNILLYYLQNKNIFVFKIPEYGSLKYGIEQDIENIANTKIKMIDFENISFKDLGHVDQLIINKNEIIFINKKVDDKYLKKLKNLFLQSSEYEKELLAARISKLENGIATIYVGGNTKIEKKEKMMRFEDALCALEVSKNGILPGEGISLLRISEQLEEKTVGDKIIKKALHVPFKKIMNNIGVSYENIYEQIKKSNFQKIYNCKTNLLEDISNTEIIDPAPVLVEALTNACSIASMLLTTNYLVINDDIKIEKDLL